MSEKLAFEIARKLCDGVKRKNLLLEYGMTEHAFNSLVRKYLSPYIGIAPHHTVDYPRFKKEILHNLKIEEELSIECRRLEDYRIALVEAARRELMRCSRWDA